MSDDEDNYEHDDALPLEDNEGDGEFDENDYVIEAVLRRRKRVEKLNGMAEYEYEIQWKGYDESENKWCTEHELYDLNASGMAKIKQFNEGKKKDSKEKKKKPKEDKKEAKMWNQAQEVAQQQAHHEIKKIIKKQRIEREEQRILSSLEEEARRTAAEEDRRVREEQERKKYAAMQEVYSALKKPLVTPLNLPVIIDTAITTTSTETTTTTVTTTNSNSSNSNVTSTLSTTTTSTSTTTTTTTTGTSATAGSSTSSAAVHSKKAFKSDIPTLWNLTLTFVCDNILLYDGFENVPVQWKALMFHKLSIKKKLTTDKFETLLDPYQNWLNLTICRGSVTQDFFKSFQKSPYLSSLTLVNCVDLVFMWIPTLGETCPNLRQVNFSGSRNLNSIEGLGKCTNLRELIIRDCNLCSGYNKGIDDIYQLKLLEILDISDNPYISRNKYIQLFASLPELTQLYANNTNYATSHSIPYAQAGSGEKQKRYEIKCSKLRILQIHFDNFSFVSDINFVYNFFGSRNSDGPGNSKINYIPFQNVEELHFNCYPAYFEPIINVFPSLKSLKYGTLPDTVYMATYPSIIPIDAVPEKFQNLQKFQDPITGKMYCPIPAEILNNNSEIHSLDLRQLSHEYFREVAKMSSSKLKSLKINNYSMETKDFVNLLKNQDIKLETLELSNAYIFRPLTGIFVDPENIHWQRVPLPYHVNLKRLVLSHNPWLNMNALKRIIVACPFISYLDIAHSHCYGSDDGLLYILRNCPNLTSLTYGGHTPARTVERLMSHGQGYGDKLKALQLSVDIPWEDGSKSLWERVFGTFPNLTTFLFISTNHNGHVYYNFYESVMQQCKHLKNLAVMAKTSVKAPGFHSFLSFYTILETLILPTSVFDVDWKSRVIKISNDKQVTLDWVSGFTEPYKLPKVQLSPQHPHLEEDDEEEEEEEEDPMLGMTFQFV